MISVTVVPVINRARYRQWQAEHSATADVEKAYLRELQLLEQKYPRPYAGWPRVNIPIPFGAAILIAGIGALASDGRKDNHLPQATQLRRVPQSER